MRSVSGVRGIVGVDLTSDIVRRYAQAYGVLVRDRGGRRIGLARDSRASGPVLYAAAAEALAAVGIEVVELGMVSTPTAQLAVEDLALDGGIVVTASHNPIEWNALKFVGAGGRFLTRQDADALFRAADGAPAPAVRTPARRTRDDAAVRRHLERVLGLPWLDVAAIRARAPKVALDCVRGAGATVMPALFEALGCLVQAINLEPDGAFPREPEPIPEHLGQLGTFVRETGADIGIAVDPDVDRLAIVDETGRPIGEDYTLAFAVRAVLPHLTGPLVTNLSTSLVVDDAARAFGHTVERAPVGEANVVERMIARGAVLGGEGNGGVILPAVHLGRDAPVAAVLALALLARERASVSAMVNAAPRYAIVKDKLPRPDRALDDVYAALRRRWPDADADAQDGLRLAWPGRWIHVRPSGTEPVVRVIAEAPTAGAAREMVDDGRRALLTMGD
jgi:phosphomannomutase